MQISPDFNQVVTAISPSVLVPWGWHGSGPAVGFCYNAYKRTVVYREEGENKRHTIWDKFATFENAGGWLAEGSPPTKQRPFQFEASLKGGIHIGLDYAISILPPKILQEMAESFLMMTRLPETDSLVRTCPFFWESESRKEFNKLDHIALDQMTGEAIHWLRKGDLEALGAVAERYWSRWARKLGGASPTETSYQKARVAGAYGGFPVDWDATTYAFLAPKDKHERIKAILPDWKALPYTITPFGAHICGTF